jgi:succinate dehydrogenase hydrophobic anchor subunit
MLVLYVPLLSLSVSISWISAVFLAPLFGWLVFAMIMNNDSVSRWAMFQVNESKDKVKRDMQMAAQ